ncbi:signal peptidase II [Clostridium sp. JS66]|uniref:signal peptidase II n=1 Tax=Clostridium sp. JS66 TaxID=3064705 RepID=UPI00298DE992|nr:signal peptidase II [Clostridium sp. JS66]WPC42975.1 signal peptidase II [Clostridium sp. JS66]
MSNFYNISNSSGVQIDDTIRNTEKTWSSYKIGKELDLKATKEDLNNIHIPTIPTKVSELENDSKFQSDTQVNDSITKAINALKDGVPADGDTLAKLRSLIINNKLRFWRSSFNYKSADYVVYDNCIYICTMSHTSATDFKTDYEVNGFWNLMVGNLLKIDDNNPSTDTLWSSSKTIQEIQNQKPKMKLGELADVNTNNVDDKFIISYSKDTSMWVVSPVEDVVPISKGYEYQQITQLGVKGTTTTPEIISLPYTTTDFKMPKVNVLKYKALENNLIIIEGNFNSIEQSNYVSDQSIIFDGKAHLLTSYGGQMNYSRDLNQGKEWTYHVDKAGFKDFANFNVDNSVYPNLIYQAIPNDRLLIQQQDYNLSNVEHVDYFNLVSTGNNIRIVSSTDGGVTWQYFNGTSFQTIDKLTLDNVKQHGNTLDEFNAIADRWNYVTISKKIRFAYVLDMDNISDVETIDSISLQYDGNGVWVQAKDSEYDVEINNSEIKVYLYITGDVKINY